MNTTYEDFVSNYVDATQPNLLPGQQMALIRDYGENPLARAAWNEAHAAGVAEIEAKYAALFERMRDVHGDLPASVKRLMQEAGL